jgi:hypothetical protein
MRRTLELQDSIGPRCSISTAIAQDGAQADRGILSRGRQ